MDDRELVKFLIKKRKEKHISQEEMAEIMNISSVTICGIEKGEVEMDVDMCLKAAAALGISAEEVFHGGKRENDKERKTDRRIHGLIVTVIILLVLNCCVILVGNWYNQFVMHNYMICTVVSYEDDRLTVKIRNPINEEQVESRYEIKINDRLRESCAGLKQGDVVRIHFYFKLSNSKVNSSCLVASIEQYKELKWNQ